VILYCSLCYALMHMSMFFHCIILGPAIAAGPLVVTIDTVGTLLLTSSYTTGCYHCAEFFCVI